MISRLVFINVLHSKTSETKTKNPERYFSYVNTEYSFINNSFLSERRFINVKCGYIYNYTYVYSLVDI